MATTIKDGAPLIFGEVLYDVFPGDEAVLGGAPFNVAWHLQGFGLSPLFVSRIGRDPRGDEIVAAMEQWGMRTEGIQRDDDKPTGEVQISFSGKSHSFDILSEQAYDHIEWSPIESLISSEGKPSLLYHGSLIARSGTSSATLQALRDLDTPRFIDINLREPWWSPGLVERLAMATNWFKLNDDELLQLTGISDLETAADRFRHHHRIDTMIITRGEEGALILDGADQFEATPPAIDTMVDTVGAGDAFGAVTLLGFINGWSTDTVLQRALSFASAICSIRGALPRDRGFYERYLQQWHNG